MPVNTGSFPDPAFKRAFERRTQGLPTPTLNESPLRTPVEQGVEQAPLPSPSPSGAAGIQAGPDPQQATPKTAEQEEALILSKAASARLKSLSKVMEMQAGGVI